MKISDLNYVEDIKQEEKLGTVIGGNGISGIFTLIPRLVDALFDYNPQPTVINNIYIENNNTSSSSSSSGAVVNNGSGHH